MADAAGWTLFKDGRQISKPHSSRIAAAIEAFERKVVITWRMGRFVSLCTGYEIKRVTHG